MTRLLGGIKVGDKANFGSRYGRTNGLSGVCEAGSFFYRWFPRETTSDLAEYKSLEEMDSFRRTIAAFMDKSNAPMILKNTYNSLRIRKLADAFQGAVFVHVVRDPVDTALSLLRARRDRLGSEMEWFGLRPPDYSTIKEYPPHEQVIAQVLAIRRCINEDAKRYLRDTQLFTVQYESLCQDPNSEANRFLTYMQQQGVALEQLNELPEYFEASRSNPSDAERKAMVRALKKQQEIYLPMSNIFTRKHCSNG